VFVVDDLVVAAIIAARFASKIVRVERSKVRTIVGERPCGRPNADGGEKINIY